MLDVFALGLRFLAGPFLVEGDVKRLLDRLERQPLVDPRLDGATELEEPALLVGEDFGPPHLAVAGAKRLHAEILHRAEDGDPAFGVGVAGVVEGPVHAGVAGEQDPVLRQPGDGIAGGVGVAEEEELDPLVAVVEDELVGEVEGGDLVREGAILARPVLLCSFEAVGSLRLKEGLAPLLGDDRRPELHILHVPVGVIAVVVGVENKLDRLVGALADRSDDVLRLAGEVGVDDEDVVAEDDEALVAAGEHRLGLRLAEEDTGSDLGDRRLLGGGRGGPRHHGGKSECQQRGKRGART